MKRSTNTVLGIGLVAIIGFLLVTGIGVKFQEDSDYRITSYRKSTGEVVSSRVRAGSNIRSEQRLFGFALLGVAFAWYYFTRDRSSSRP